MEIIDTVWFAGKDCIGIVVGKDEITKERKGYIGVSKSGDEKADIEYIAKTGSKVNPVLLQGIVDKLNE